MKNYRVYYYFGTCKKLLHSCKFLTNNHNGICKIYQSGFQITLEYKKTVDPFEIFKTQYFEELIKRCAIAYTLLTSKVYRSKLLKYKTSDDRNLSKLVSIIFFSLLDEKKNIVLHKSPPKIIIDKIIQSPNNNMTEDVIMIISYLLGKNKETETEKLLYFWTSFNSLYKYVTNLQKDRDALDKLRNFLENTKDERKFNRNKLCKEITDKILSQDFCDIEKCIEEELRNNVNYFKYSNLDNFILIEYAYYFRCNYIHGSKSLLLYSISGDLELKILEIVNMVLEKFLDDNIFDLDRLKEGIYEFTK